MTESDYAHLQPGQPVSLTTEAYPGEPYVGRIARIAPIFRKTTRQARIEMTIDNPQHRLKPGMFIRATVVLSQLPEATIVPEQALTIRDDRDGVFTVSELIEDLIRYRFARIPGVAQVDVWGGFNREVRIELDPDRIQAVGLPLDKVIDAIRDANLDLPAGKIEQGCYEVMLRAPAEFINLDQIRDTVIVQRDGAAITLDQIAEVKDTYEKLTRIVRVNGGRGLRVAIRKQADANTVDVAKRVLSEIEAANQAFPQIKIVPVINQGNYIERSILNVARSVLYGGGLAILVLLFFLCNIRSTLVISLSVPISIVTTFALISLALGIGEGSEAQAPLARAVVGGLTGSTLITLVLIPVVYSLFHPDPTSRDKGSE